MALDYLRDALKKPVIQLLLIAVLSTIAYANTFQVPFIFDDDAVIVANRNLNGLTTYFNSINWLSFSYKSRWLPLATFAFNKQLGGNSVIGFHLVNLLIHIATSFLVYFLAETTLALFPEKPTHRHYSFAPLLAALGFTLHPVHTQAVTYIVQRMTSLSTLFYLATILLYAKACTPAAIRTKHFSLPYVAALIASIFAMSSKEIAFTLPLSLLLFDSCFLNGTRTQRLFRLVPFFICLLIMPLYLLGISDGLDMIAHGGSTTGDMPLNRSTYLYTEFRVIITYLRLLIVPTGQRFDYDYPTFGSLFIPQVALSLAAIIAILSYGIYLLKKSFQPECHSIPLARISGFAIVWFFLTISVESGVTPLLDTINEHRLYLPSAWLFIAFALLIAHCYHYLERYRRHVVMVTLALLTSAAVATFQRNQVWHSQLSLWTDTVQKAPHKARCWTGLGAYYVTNLEPKKAISALERALAINRSFHLAHLYLGMAYLQLGNDAQAFEQYLAVTELAPRYPDGWEHVGWLLQKSGHDAEATSFLRHAAELRQQPHLIK
jgi:hypothetical protein